MLNTYVLSCLCLQSSIWCYFSQCLQHDENLGIPSEARRNLEWFSRLLETLGTPPLFTVVRVNTLLTSPDDAQQKLQLMLHEVLYDSVTCTARSWVTYALLYTSILTKSYLYPSCTTALYILTKSHLCPLCTIPFTSDQESLIPFLHYTLQFWPRVTYALFVLYPSLLTKSHLYPTCTIPFNFDQESLMPFLH